MADRRKRLMKPEKGQIQYGDRSVTDMSMHDAFNDTISNVKNSQLFVSKRSAKRIYKVFRFFKNVFNFN